MGLRKATFWGLLLAIAAGIFSCTPERRANVLVFSKTEGYRHESIEAGIAALKKMAAEKGFDASFTEDSEAFSSANLEQYQAVVFLNTTDDVLNAGQQDAFERFIQAGGGYVGIHSATDTEYDWPWYGGLAGAYFKNHPNDPNVRTATMVVQEKDHWATEGMPDEFEKTDEFYNFRNISTDINVVLTIDENSYEGGENGDFHPMSWYQEYDGGRGFYTAMGHTPETFSEPIFLDHLWAGIQYAIGRDQLVTLDYSRARPEENRFTKVVLEDNLNEPTELTVLDEDRILFLQRNGEVRMYKNSTQELKTIAQIPVRTTYAGRENSRAEDGLLGLNKDPNFEENNWIYIFYSSPEKPANILSRFEMKGDELLLESEKQILEIPVQLKECCHTGGSIAWGPDGNLYLSTGDNTNPHESNGYSPSDERPGRGPFDAQKSSANTNDLRGKILRITPQPDGSYTIPEGNLFPEGTPKTRPEIYTMGHRNPYRISIDQKTGFLYWGDVGPDASIADPNRGPAGHDEIGQAREAGNFGWPYFVGDNKAYHKYDFAKKVSMGPWDPNAPVNTSPNNSGLEKLPPALEAFIWYPYAPSEEFPLPGTGGRNAMAGPVYYFEDFKDAERAFPEYYDGKLFIYDWMRGWIMVVTMDDKGDLKSMERFMPSYKFSNPMDMAFAENGDLYVLEYGTAWFTQNKDARLVRIEYNGGNRKPQIQMASDKRGGTVPLTLQLSAEGTKDPDGDPLEYIWYIQSANGFKKILKSPTISLTLEEAGVYQASLTVEDGVGGVSKESMEFVAGNEVPELRWELAQGNRSFYMPGAPINYEVKLTDREDGVLGSGIAPERVAVNIDYFPEGFDKIEIAAGHRSADDVTLVAKGKELIDGSDCLSCHKVKEKSIGPSYQEVALRYKDEPGAVEELAGKIINGGAGVWGETAMAGHPTLTLEQASEMVEYILSLAKEELADKVMPVKGTYAADVPEGDPGKGVYVLRAAYEDNGAQGLPSLRSEEMLILRNANMSPHAFDFYDKVMQATYGGNELGLIQEDGAYMGLKKVDMANLQAVLVLVNAPVSDMITTVGGRVELRLDSPTGPVLGMSSFIEPDPQAGFTPKPLQIPVTLPDDFDGEMHDVYLVFGNEKAEQGMLMIVVGTQFMLNSPKLNM